MWPTQSFNEPIAGYYSNSLDYQNNLINNGSSNFYTNNSSVLKQSPPVMNNSALSPVSEDETNLKKKRKGQRNYRKVMIEKKRRDRINKCLDELRKLVPAANEKQGSAKLEKAEILQMTVDHLMGLSAKGFDTFSFEPNKFALEHFTIGFKECASEVARHLSSVEGFALNDPLKLRLISHLQRYFAQREYNLKSCSGLQSVWNPNVFLLPQTTSQTTLTSNSSLINSTNTFTDSQLINSNINTNSVSPITTLPSNLSNHSNSSIGSSNNSNSYQQLNHSNESNTSSSPICNSPVANNNVISASQLLNQHPCRDNNNNTSTSNSNNFSNTITNSNVNSHSESSTTNLISASINEDQRSLLSGMMPPPPPPPPTLLQKVTILNNVSPHSPNTSELTYTNMNSAPNAYVTHHHHVSSTFPHLKMDPSQISSNGYTTPSYVAVAAAAAVSQNHSNHAHHSQYFNTALAYGTGIGQTMPTSMSGTAVSIPNSSITSSNNNSQHSTSTKYCRPWGAEMAY